MTTKSENALLLPLDERVFQLPHMTKGSMGRSNIGYADDPNLSGPWREKVLEFVDTKNRKRPVSNSNDRPPRQPDVFLRQQVELTAMQVSEAHYRELGYLVTSVAADNVGWDLNAVCDRRELQLEVKGLSGSDIWVELTRNEFEKMNLNQRTYRVCVVTNALTNPSLHVFAYSSDSGRWETPDRKVLQITEVVSARCRVI